MATMSRLEGEAFKRDRAVVESLVGRTIVSAEWNDANPSDDWSEHQYARLTLDDSRVIRFGGWGYDAWGATLDITNP